MAFIGNTNTTQAFTPAIDYFSGNGSTTAFTLSRPVASVAQVEVYVSNVPQTPSTAYTVSGNTITFTSAPLSGTNNIYVYYTSPITQVIAPSQGTVNTTSLGTITNIASGSSSLTLQTGASNTTAVTIDTSQNVGIGTSSPSQKLNVSGGSIMTDSGGSTSSPSLMISSGALGTAGLYAPAANTLGFVVSATERMRIDSSGNLLVNTTATSNITKLTTYNAGNAFITANTNTSNLSTPSMQVSKGDNNTTTSNCLVQFLVNGFANGSGQINANGANAAAFGSFSDSRLKENVVDLPSQLANIMALRPVEFDYIKSEGGGHQIGFVAQEVQEIYPDLVGEREDGMFTLSDLNKNDARLIKAIQEMKAIIDTQANTITALTARIEALENK